MDEKIVKDSQGLAKELVNDCISRRAAIDAVTPFDDEYRIRDAIEDLPSAQPETAERTAETAQNVSDGDLISRKAVLDELRFQYDRDTITDPEDGTDWILYEEAVRNIEKLPSAQPDLSGYSDKLWRIAYERGKAEAMRWIPCSERMPNHELVIVQYGDGDFDLLQFPTAYRREDIVAWMPLPEPYREEEQDG